MKKIAYLLDSFPRLSETFILNEIIELKRNDIDVIIISIERPDEKIYHSKAKEMINNVKYLSHIEVSVIYKIFLHLYFLIISPVKYIKTFIFSYKRKKEGRFWHFKQSVIYAIALKKANISNIHSHYFSSVCTEYAMLVSMLIGVPFTFTAHGWHDIFTFPPHDFFDRAQKAKAIVTISNFNKAHLHKQFQIPLHKINVIHCGIDTSFFSPNNNNRKENIILSIARLHPVKGIQYLIKACGILKEEGYKFKCFIIGEGEEEQNLRNLISELKLNDFVNLTGGKTSDEVLKYLNKAKIFVLPSIYESMGVATMEAMASKVPVIATNVWGVPELVDDGINGFLVPPENPPKIVDCIKILLNSPEFCIKFGEEGRLKVENEFNLKKEVKKLLDLWNIA